MQSVNPPTLTARLQSVAGLCSRLFQWSVPWTFSLGFLWVALAMIPTVPDILGTGLDASWAYGINLAHAQNLIFGRDVVFTFGPLGYLFYPIPGLAGSWAALGFAWAIYALFLFGLFLIWRSLGHRLIVLVSWAVLAAAMLFTT